MASIEFKLFAPYNNSAALMGEFSEWDEIPMERGDDGYFRTAVDLQDGQYQYKFRVQSKSWFFEPDEWVDVNDPYLTNIDDPSQNGIVRIKDGDRIVDTYVWQHDDHSLPSDRELVIYELHIHDFSGGEDDPKSRGRYEHVIRKLDYLQDLGINAIELMPIMEYPGDYSWGYNPRYFFASESSYGTTEELKQLIDECHGRGMRVIMDGIFNHSESSSPLTQIDHDYWYHHEPRDSDNSWGPEFNYEHYDENLDVKPAWKFIGDAIQFWIEEYHVDGIRYDAARQIENHDFMHWVVKKTKEKAGAKPFFNVAEYIPESPTITNVDGPMDSCWHNSFYHTVKAHICGDRIDFEALKAAIDCRRQGFLGATNVVNYLTNHDHERIMVELGNQGIFKEAAFQRLQLGGAILMTAVGVPMIWMGEEFGSYQPLGIEPAKIDWQLLRNDGNQNLLQYYKGLTRLRRENHALYTENVDFFHEDPEAGVLAYTRWNDAGARVAVVANFSDAFLTGYHLPSFPKAGTWHEWTKDYDVTAGENGLSLDLGEYEAQVLVWM